jgi:hypothetical protein
MIKLSLTTVSIKLICLSLGLQNNLQASDITWNPRESEQIETSPLSQIPLQNLMETTLPAHLQLMDRVHPFSAVEELARHFLTNAFTKRHYDGVKLVNWGYLVEATVCFDTQLIDNDYWYDHRDHRFGVQNHEWQSGSYAGRGLFMIAVANTLRHAHFYDAEMQPTGGGMMIGNWYHNRDALLVSQELQNSYDIVIQKPEKKLSSLYQRSVGSTQTHLNTYYSHASS